MYHSILVRLNRSVLASFSAIFAVALVGSFLIAPSLALADGGAINITSPATGASNISIDTTSTGGTDTPVDLDGPALAETSAGSIAVGTHTLTLPPGWKFVTGSSISIVKIGAGLSFGSTNITPDLHSFSFTVASVSTSPATVMFFGLQVVPEGTTPGSGEITYSGAGMGVISGSWGTLSTVAGTPTQLKIEDSASEGNEIEAQDVISGENLTVYSNEYDQFGNFVANVVSDWSLTNQTPSSGGVETTDLSATNGASTVLTGHLVGVATLHAVADSFSVDSGVITVTAGPVDVDNSTVAVDSGGIAVVSNGANVVTVTVTAMDAAGNKISGEDVVVSATGDEASNTITPVSPTTDVNGVATFTISSTKAEAKTVSATIGGNPVTQTQPVTFTHGPAAQLAIVTQPSSTATAGDAFAQQPIINVLDEFENLVTDSTDVITAAIGTGTGVLKSTGDLTATAVAGVATFSGLYYEKAETITIDFSSGSLTSDTSESIDVSPNVPD